MWLLRNDSGAIGQLFQILAVEKGNSMLATRVKRPKKWDKIIRVASQLGIQDLGFDLKGGKSGA
jgi:hypothetical protein